MQPFDERPTIVVVERAPPPLPAVGGGATSDAVMAALEVVSLVVHYKPRPKENCEPFKLKLKVPATKTVAALMKAFCKAVATSQRGYGLLLDPDDCFVTKMDAPPPKSLPRGLASSATPSHPSSSSSRLCVRRASCYCRSSPCSLALVSLRSEDTQQHRLRSTRRSCRRRGL